MFNVYLELGFDHILDWNGYDHILFLVALCAIFSVRDWRRVLILVTAFTLGHSLTLALSALDLFTLPARLVEVLIPVTILITALQNLVIKPEQKASWWAHYAMALGFGFIHGMGFSNYFKSLLGRETSILLPLFSFNLGVEIGQLIIVAAGLIINFLVVRTAGLKQNHWTIGLSLLAAILAVRMIIERL